MLPSSEPSQFYTSLAEWEFRAARAVSCLEAWLDSRDEPLEENVYLVLCRELGKLLGVLEPRLGHTIPNSHPADTYDGYVLEEMRTLCRSVDDGSLTDGVLAGKLQIFLSVLSSIREKKLRANLNFDLVRETKEFFEMLKKRAGSDAYSDVMISSHPQDKRRRRERFSL